MKRTKYYALLIAAAVCSAAFAILGDESSLLLTVFRFPLGLIGDGLRALSLSGAAGNILAWMIYVLVCLLPAAAWMLLRRRSKDPSNLILLVLSPVVAVALYRCINPFVGLLSKLGPELLQAQYGAVVYVLLVSLLILRTVSAFRAAHEPALYKAMGVFLKLLGVLFVVSAFGERFGELLSSVETLRASNQNSGSLSLTYVFLGLQCLVDVLPLLLDTAAVIIALELLEAFAADREDTAACAEQLAKWCGTTLTVTAMVTALFHVLQMLFLHTLRDVNTNLSLPIGSMAFLLVCLIAARIIAENKALKADNDLFI